MKIREYLDKHGLIIQDLADLLNCSWTYAWRIVRGMSNPSTSLAHQIEIWTKGAVKVHEVRKCTRHCQARCECSKGGK